MSIFSWIKSKFLKPSTTHTESKGFFWKNEWGEVVKTYVTQNIGTLNTAIDLKRIRSDYWYLSVEQQIAVWVEFFKALAFYESSYNPDLQLVDVGTPGNRNTYSIGLLQLSVVDQSNLGIRLGFGYSDLLKPENNLRLGVLILANQIKKRGKIFIPKGETGDPGVYWATMNPGNRNDKSEQIIATVNALKFQTELSNSDTSWMNVANSEKGVSEVSGSKHNPRIVEYHQSTTLKAKDDETAWCASFVCWVLQRAGYLSTKSAWARDYLNYGSKCGPQYGCIVVFSRGTDSGHVGFYVEEDADYIYVLGGNQNNEVNVSKYPKSRVLGYRWPVRAQ